MYGQDLPELCTPLERDRDPSAWRQQIAEWHIEDLLFSVVGIQLGFVYSTHPTKGL